MGERRKRKSLWDTEKETKCFSGMSNHNSWTEKECHSNNDSGHYNKLSASEIHTAAKSTDHSGQPSWKSIEENSVVSTNGSFMKSRQTAPEGMEISGRNRDYQDVSPGFDGQRKFSRTLESCRSHSRRYMGKGRSRSRSRSRTRGRSRSRSLSRGRRKERGRAQGRSRSSGSSRSDGSAKGGTRNHSPVGDYRHQSYAWSDRRSLPDKSSQICKDFAAGRCRRGSHCRFFHPKNVSREDGDLMGDNAGESWCKRADYGQISKHSFRRGPGSRSDLQGDVSEPCHERQDEQFLSNSKSAVLCKDFMKGKCRLGDTCRLSHHFDSDETLGKGTRYASSDKDIEQEHVKNGKPLCKYFLAGKCDRDNCRFSHEDPKFNRLEGRKGEATNEGSFHDRSNLWKGPTWNDPTRISDNVKDGGWSETTTTLVNLASDMTNAKNDNRWGHSLENENSGCGIPEWTDNSINQDKEPPLPAGIGGYDRDAGTAESTGKEKMAYRQQHHTLHGSQLQNQDGHHTLQEDPSFSMKAWLQNVSAISQIQQQHHGVVENDLLSSFQSNVIDATTNSSSATQPIIFSGQNLNKNDENVFQGDSSISNETDGRKNMHRRNPPNESSCSLNGPETHPVAPFSLQAQLQNHMKAFQMSETLEGKASLVFSNLSSTEQASELTNSATAFAGEHVTPVTVAVNMIPFSDTLVNVSHVNANITQSDPVKVSHDPIDPMESGRGMNEHGSHKEQDNEIKVGKSSPLSIVDSKPDNSIVDRSGSPKLKQETVLANSEGDAVNRAIGNESKGMQNNKHSQTLDGNGKDGESGANKDEKGMRLFKNSLIEFVKEILKPTWKEGQMSREVHKSIVKKVVDKVTSTIQADHIPKTQDKVNQYLSYSKPKIAKLVQAYVGRSIKTHS